MKPTVGQTLKSAVDAAAFVVIRCPDGDLTVACGGREMAEDAVPGQEAVTADGPGPQLGKRYIVEGMEVELLCVHAGDHRVTVNGAEVVQKNAEPLPASD